MIKHVFRDFADGESKGRESYDTPVVKYFMVATIIGTRV